VPNAGSPFAMTYGGREIGASLGAFAAVADAVSGTLSFASALSGVIAGYERREQEWTLQKNTAAYEVAQMDAQIAGAAARVDSLRRDVAINTLSIEQNNEIQLILTSRFSTADLYGWMASRLQALYFQTYKVALDLALAAQRAFQYELDTQMTFLDFSYWESGRSGLLAGEGLQLALGQREHAYYTSNRRRLKVDKVVSLWALDPVALLTLQRTGSCSITSSEVPFWPGPRNVFPRLVKLPADGGRMVRTWISRLSADGFSPRPPPVERAPSSCWPTPCRRASMLASGISVQAPFAFSSKDFSQIAGKINLNLHLP
jgi:hypothetical protein